MSLDRLRFLILEHFNLVEIQLGYDASRGPGCVSPVIHAVVAVRVLIDVRTLAHFHFRFAVFAVVFMCAPARNTELTPGQSCLGQH